MIRLTITITFLINVLCGYGQSKIIQTQIGKESFIQISNETIIELFEQSFQDWERLMVQLGYKKMDDSEGILTYSKGEIGIQTQAVAKSRIGLLSIDWFDFKDKIRLTKELEKSLQSYFVKVGNGISYYDYKGYIIGLKVYEDVNYLRESVYIRAK